MLHCFHFNILHWFFLLSHNLLILWDICTICFSHTQLFPQFFPGPLYLSYLPKFVPLKNIHEVWFLLWTYALELLIFHWQRSIYQHISFKKSILPFQQLSITYNHLVLDMSSCPFSILARIFPGLSFNRSDAVTIIVILYIRNYPALSKKK